MPPPGPNRAFASFLVGGLAALFLSSPRWVPQVRRSSADPFVWPPPPEDVLHVWGREDHALRPGGLLDLFDVPDDRYLVLEWAYVASPESDPFSGTGFEVLEEKDGALTLKSNWLAAIHGRSGSGTGAVFRPGSRVVVRNATGQTSTELTLLVVGYYRDAR